MGTCYIFSMRIIARKTLRDFWSKPGYADAEQPLKAWFKLAEEADWAKPSAIKKALASASIVGDNRVVFNIAGNKYRLVAKINYSYRVLYIRFIGTHRQYDAIDVTEI
jgi:mRNA interferase HigB